MWQPNELVQDGGTYLQLRYLAIEVQGHDPFAQRKAITGQSRQLHTRTLFEQAGHGLAGMENDLHDNELSIRNTWGQAQADQRTLPRLAET